MRIYRPYLFVKLHEAQHRRCFRETQTLLRKTALCSRGATSAVLQRNPDASSQDGSLLQRRNIGGASEKPRRFFVRRLFAPEEDYVLNRVISERVINSTMTSKAVRSSAIHRTSCRPRLPNVFVNLHEKQHRRCFIETQTLLRNTALYSRGATSAMLHRNPDASS